jgi:hypothetical protein
MKQKLEAVRMGDRIQLVALFHGENQEFYLDVDLYLKMSERWLQYRGFPCTDLDEAREFFDSVAESWGELPSTTWVFIMKISPDPPKDESKFSTWI